MKTLFLDTNVIIDLLAKRVPFYDTIAKVATLADEKKIRLVCSPISFTTVEYVLRKYETSEAILSKLRKFKIICNVCEVNEETIEKALNSGFADFEDSVQYFSAIQSHCSILITRNGKDFKNSAGPIMTAEEYLSSLV
ncbi:MAG: PIN domain-containing protein [Aequorivita sp.]|nr:PIN domain-containing protein [Aequorivita sp.]